MLPDTMLVDADVPRMLVFTNGCFDLLHAGHVEFLAWARRQGERLIVGLNDDDSVHRLKGPGRPILPQRERILVLRALRCVDDVVVFSEGTAVHLIERLRPQVYAKGPVCGEQEPCPEMLAQWARGGHVAIAPWVLRQSTTAIVERVRAQQGSR